MRERTRIHSVATACTLVVALGVSGGSLAAQNDPPHCAGAAAELTAGAISVAGLRVMRGCPISGPPTLGAIWARSPLPGDEALEELVWSSAYLADTRLHAALMGVVSSGRPAIERVHALRVLYFYLDPRGLRMLDGLTRRTQGDLRPIELVGSQAHGRRRPVAQPIGPEIRSTLPEVLFRLSTDDLDPAVRFAALELRRGYAYIEPAHTPFPVGVLTLSAECEREVEVAYSGDVSIKVELRILGSSQVLPPLEVGAPRPGQVSRVTLSRFPPGVVVATIGGREMARLSARPATPCRE